MSKPLLIVIVTLMTPQGETGVQTHFNEIAKYARKMGFSTSIINPYQYHVIIRKSAALVARLLKQINQELAVIWVRWAHYWFLRRIINRNIRDTENITVVYYAQDPLSAKAALKERSSSNQYVTTVVHFNISEAYECELKGLTKEGGMLYRSLEVNERMTLPKVDKILYVSSFMEKTVLGRLPAMIKVPHRVIPNFIDDPQVNEDTADIEGDILTIGTLEARKNQEFILRVLAEAKSRGHTYKLTIIGDGPKRKYLETLAKDLGIAGIVHFAGFKFDASKYMQKHSVYAHASLMESMGIVLIEAMAYARPIIAIPVGGVPEVFSNECEGYYWDGNNVKDAADKLIKLLEDSYLYENMSRLARLRYEKYFSAGALARRWVTEITTVNNNDHKVSVREH